VVIFRLLQLWLVLGVFLAATSLRMYATCQQLQAQAQAHAAAANGYLRHAELRVRVPPTIALATRGRLQSLRLQLALLDREFDDLGLSYTSFTLVNVFCLLQT
jgi:E3 ubiquitin-protein ligase SDIR1